MKFKELIERCPEIANNYLDFEIGKYDPNVYVYVGDKSVNYDKLDKRIKTIYNSKIYKGIKIVYKNILYDFSLS